MSEARAWRVLAHIMRQTGTAQRAFDRAAAHIAAQLRNGAIKRALRRFNPAHWTRDGTRVVFAR
eukprot:4894381-Lingulodinium_polyedra.AAC.1